MCLYPKLIRNKKYRENKKNGGVIPPITDIRTTYVPIACGQCMECMKAKSREWQTRLMEEIKTSTNGKFVTLTFSEEQLNKIKQKVIREIKINEKNYQNKDIENEIARTATRLFLERWRKLHKKSIRHWLVTELGHQGTERIHMHGILFTDKTKEEIEQIWKYGMIWIGKYVNEKTINYIVKYIYKQDEQHKSYKPKILASIVTGKQIGRAHV